LTNWVDLLAKIVSFLFSCCSKTTKVRNSPKVPRWAQTLAPGRRSDHGRV